MKAKRNLALPILLMLVFALTRWPGLMPQNFSAAYALAFCAGAFFPGNLAWSLPLGTLLVTDVLLNAGYYHVQPFTFEILGNYVAYVLLIWLGKRITGRAPFLRLLGGGILGAILFYLITNTISWLHDPAYPKNLAGWIQALTVGTPGWPQTWEFFRNTLMSGGLFTGLFVGAMKLGEAVEEQEEEKEPEEEPAAEPQEAETEKA